MQRLHALRLFAQVAARALKFAELRRAHGQVGIMFDGMHRRAGNYVRPRGGALSMHAFADDFDKLLEARA